MEEILIQSQITAMDKSANVVLDIESLAQSSDKSSGSPKMTKALSRKGSSRIERRNSEEQEVEESSRKLVVKVANSQMEPLKQPLISTKPLILVTTMAVNGSSTSDAPDVRSKRFNRFGAIHPKKILLIFATLSSMGTLMLIYFTLAIGRRSAA
ncbi:uncharacterized protein LOC131243008 isoform X2 [Magnolia sinica]|uniref:uncharacterized protein LOC131243008 isoform X2 n=1 Tax=Magnolia sinica TaxID=86752 RepID=UPI00265B24F0|nr:uncharacterized protein LOC131243008 isoform X2 [Magnolia sinica]